MGSVRGLLYNRGDNSDKLCDCGGVLCASGKDNILSDRLFCVGVGEGLERGGKSRLGEVVVDGRDFLYSTTGNDVPEFYVTSNA